MYSKGEEGESRGREGVAEIIIGKQRNGPVGKVELAFRKEFSRFDNLARGYDG